ncbi:helix-turn-helix domain-containing protein [Microbacterium marinilacus]|uniref:HTH iclR-type domain-containing protein n=1 Tax=Microbacterium marinilacus TaxID=415209 RepID=A0ABP7BTS9_9MICO|nr:helix-turn-helix domain-containing protein [Microbacterium marinilacus]MBY0688219.1 helix-turn-helix domain-containing protein [Microbacterium marinilacus]
MTQWDLHPKQPRAIHSALLVLEEVASAGPGVTVRELVDRLALPRATVYRLVNLLVEEEYLVRLADIAGLALGTRVARLTGSSGSTAAGGWTLDRPPRAARELLARLRDAAGGVAVHLVVYDSGAPVPFDVDPAWPLADPVAMEHDLDRSAAGRLLLAERDGGASGMAVQSDLLARGRACVAVPLRRESGALAAALCAGGPSDRMDLLLAAAHRHAASAERLSSLLT